MERRELLAAAGGVSLGFGLDYVIDSFGPSQPSQLSSNILSKRDISSVDVFIIAGQSNAVGQGNKNQSPKPNDLELGIKNTAFMYQQNPKRAPFEPLIDPVGIEPHTANSGSAWPAFADSYWNSTNRMSIYVPAAIGGTAVHPKAAGSNPKKQGTWGGPAGMLYRAFGRLRGVIGNLTAANIDYRYRGVLFHQGERDARAIDANNSTPEAYRKAFKNMLTRYRFELSNSEAPFYIFQVGQPLDGDTTGFQQVRDVQQTIAENDPHTTMVFDESVRFAEEGLMIDRVHYNQTALNKMGRVGAENVVESIE